ncbi:MAG: crotonase/enoyl-CoA hydratase family protein [Rhodocyclaceae bacterium]|jgi:enoyl-CoA hydratase|nr:crotonase/enoyl-CoA hydratase family protein [Rhodocyclaceae bacterium]
MPKWLATTATITFEVRDRVAHITLNRPEKRNAINKQMLAELKAALLEADDLKSVHCILLQGAGKDFCAGYDLEGGYAGKQEEPDHDPADYRGRDSFDDDLWQLRLGGEARMAIFDIFKPVIAKVHGNCLAGGTDLALMCDMVVAATDARIGFPATRAIGSPANHMWLYHCGPQWAKYMLMTGDTMAGRDAARIGLVMKAFAPDRLDAGAEALARRIAHGSADLLAAHKRIVNVGLELMGARTLQRMAGENDGRAHRSRAFAQFFDVMGEHGLKEALRQRDTPYGEGLVSLDDTP